MGSADLVIRFVCVSASLFLPASGGRGHEKAAQKDGAIKVVISERWQIPSQMPASYAEYFDPNSPKCFLKKGDLLPDGFMSMSFYGGTLDPKKKTTENLIWFFVISPKQIRTMMDGMEDLDAKLVERLVKKPKAILVGRDRLALLHLRVGDTIKVTGLNYQGIDLVLEIVGELPAGRYDQSAIMNEAYLREALAAYKKKFGQAHRMAHKSLSLIWLKVPNEAAFQRIQKAVENAPQFRSLPLKCENAEMVIRLPKLGKDK
jgi:putative ABC transport system permease protein